ncbi:MAG TPA: hypothetical protein DHU96_30590 [Actinobacteria bacterium]|nr:hypothetical protein [Actinomycetota bacterium]
MAQVAAWFGLGTVIDVRPLAEGLMNRNWRVTTPTCVAAVRQVLDSDADQARRQHAPSPR